MSGFPHSEICGSKVAHTSPQLIAACHVLHRLYAPRHPRIALTSRLRAHTTNINAAHSAKSTANAQVIGRHAQRMPPTTQLVRDNNLSHCIKTRMYSFALRPRSLTATQPHSKPTPRGIDFKNPFTMSKRKPKLPQTAACHSGSDVFIKPGNTREAGRYSTTLTCASPHAPVSRSKAAPRTARCAALAGLAGARRGGAYRDRTDDLMLAKQPLSQLS
jgi:hypothetical protein